MNKEDRILDLPLSERDDFYSDDSLYNINSWGADLSFRELINQYSDGDLIKPELQRNYIWDKSEASRFIDSLLFGLPVPSIFLAKTPEYKMLIVDGYQRIMTVFDYVKGIFSKDGKVFKLTNSNKINGRWRGKAFSELTATQQRKILTTTIHCIIFVQVEPKDDDTSMYQIFERINTSGRTLLPQEIRNCVYQGSFNSTLIELNNELSWRNLYGLNQPDTRMRDIELILRFLALESGKIRSIDSKQISLKKFLNDFMGEHSKDASFLEIQKTKFQKVINFIHDHIGTQAFNNISHSPPYKMVKKINPTIFDSIMIATSYSLERNNNNLKIIDNLESRRLKLLQNDNYQDLIRVRTTDINRIMERFSLATEYLYELKYE